MEEVLEWKAKLEQLSTQLRTEMENLRGSSGAADKNVHELKKTKQALEQQVEEMENKLKENQWAHAEKEKLTSLEIKLSEAMAKSAQFPERNMEKKWGEDHNLRGIPGVKKGENLTGQSTKWGSYSVQKRSCRP